MKYLITVVVVGCILLSTKFAGNTALKPEAGEELSGGSGTVFNASASAFGYPDKNLNAEEALYFFTGNSLFNQSWVTAPASTTARDGLGPLFNARSCSSCHLRDGRGRPPAFDGEKSHGLLLRLAHGNNPHSGPIADPVYGAQLQDRAIRKLEAEAEFKIIHKEITGTYPDGTPYSLCEPTYQIVNEKEGDINVSEISPRIANQMIGMGLLEAIDEETLLSFADEHDSDGDGISGRPNYVWNVEANATTIGRFGWKANQPTLRQQVAAAFSGDLGITSSIFPEENCPPSVDCDQIPNGGYPEIPDENLHKVALYSSSLAVPGRRDWKDEEVLKGKFLFAEANCGSCHIPKITTAKHPVFEAFSDKTIRPYTDLRLHDMGEALADNAGDYLANGREWRTPPLWGIGLFKIVNKHTYYLHDGRARNLEEAILWHGGEAEASKQAFMKMDKEEREQLIKFLKSL
ncbi:MAG: di-heme oxidoredictase family protein [Bacteroidota bacterium]